jgi:uncharacterized coiled-coil protein SlyX
MNNADLISRIEALESRLMHQEAALDEITRTLVRQEQLVSTQKKVIETLENQLQSLTAAAIISAEEEPPPHY